VPPLNQDFSLQRYQAEALRCGVTDAIHMEVDVAPEDIEAETRNVEALAKEPGSLLRGAISACRPESAEFPAFLERQLANPFVKGFRRVLHVVPDETSQSVAFRANLRRLSGTGLPFDLCLRSEQLGIAIALADAAPDVQFVLDHCGNPGIEARAEHPWRESIAELARRPNVAGKISGIITNAGAETWSAEDLRPYVEHMIESFGWDRVVWGSDWPVCTLAGTLSNWVAATHALTRGCSESERERLFSANARRIWRL
jgi:predicted TIM-barrel fold metal-dependent hydrolase